MDQKPNYPKIAAARHPTTGEPILLKPYTRGYAPAPPGFDPEAFNKTYGISPAMVEAMLCGSLMNAWDYPCADPKNYNSEGKSVFATLPR